jgi:hypothetical protein
MHRYLPTTMLVLLTRSTRTWVIAAHLWGNTAERCI